VSSSAQSTRDDLNVDYARQIVLKIAHAADLVYAQGPPAQFVVEVNVPDGVEEASVSGQEILLKMRVGNALTDVHAATVGNLTGNISIMQYDPGLVPVTVKAQRLEVGSVVVNVTV
jgi:hypothetical protein